MAPESDISGAFYLKKKPSCLEHFLKIKLASLVVSQQQAKTWSEHAYSRSYQLSYLTFSKSACKLNNPRQISTLGHIAC